MHSQDNVKGNIEDNSYLSQLLNLSEYVTATFNDIAKNTRQELELVATDILYNPKWQGYLQNEAILENFLENKELNTAAFKGILASFKTAIDNNKSIARKKEVKYALKIALLSLLKKDDSSDIDYKKQLMQCLYDFTQKLHTNGQPIDKSAAVLLAFVIKKAEQGNTESVINTKEVKEYLKKEFSLTRKEYAAMKVREGLKTSAETAQYLAKTLGKALLEPIVLTAQLYYRKIGTREEIKKNITPYIGTWAAVKISNAAFSWPLKPTVENLSDQEVRRQIYEGVEKAAKAVGKKVNGTISTISSSRKGRDKKPKKSR